MFSNSNCFFYKMSEKENASSKGGKGGKGGKKGGKRKSLKKGAEGKGTKLPPIQGC